LGGALALLLALPFSQDILQLLGGKVVKLLLFFFYWLLEFFSLHENILLL
jgi:hypothetical protein